MKVKVYYSAIHTMEVDVDEKYRSLCDKDDDFTDEEENLTTEMIDKIDAYIQQIDPNISESHGLVGIDCDIDWEW